METDTDWMTAGACRAQRPDTFFPSDGAGVEVARSICATCPVQEPCLEYALENRIDHGVWGGVSERGRRRILRQRRRATHRKLDSDRVGVAAPGAVNPTRSESS